MTCKYNATACGMGLGCPCSEEKQLTQQTQNEIDEAADFLRRLMKDNPDTDELMGEEIETLILAATNYHTVDPRIADFFNDDLGIGYGDDPIGFLIASHREMARQRNKAKANQPTCVTVDEFEVRVREKWRDAPTYSQGFNDIVNLVAENKNGIRIIPNKQGDGDE